jgi:hypothetical protein
MPDLRSDYELQTELLETIPPWAHERFRLAAMEAGSYLEEHRGVVLGNPLLTIWQKHNSERRRRWVDVSNRLSNDEANRRRFLRYSLRTREMQVVHARASILYSYAVPNMDAIAAIEKHAPILEIGAGRGYWARLLRDHGVPILAYDQIADEPSLMSIQWTEVLVGRGKQIAPHYPDHTLMLCWPPPDFHRSHMASDSLIAHHAKGGGKDMSYSLLSAYAGRSRAPCNFSILRTTSKAPRL